MNVRPLRIAGTYQSRYSRNGVKLVSSASRNKNNQYKTSLPLYSGIYAEGRSQWLLISTIRYSTYMKFSFLSGMQNEDDSSAPTVFGIDIGYLNAAGRDALIYCDYRESYMRKFSSFFEIVSSQAS